MTASVFTDPLRKAALLVSDEPIYALGPVMVADDLDEATEAMLSFVAALERDPSEMPTIALMVEWQGFLGAITGTVVGIPTTAQETPGDAESPPAGESSPETPTGPTSPHDGSQDAAGSLPGDLRVSEGLTDSELEQVAAGIDPDPEPDDDDDDEEELNVGERLAQIPGGTPRQRGKIECFACQGTGHSLTNPQDTCNLCHGEGKIDEPEPQPQPQTAEEKA